MVLREKVGDECSRGNNISLEVDSKPFGYYRRDVMV